MTPNKFIRSRPAIYGIRNLINGKLYVGKTHCMYQRCSQYLYGYANNKVDHINVYLLSAMKKVGIQNFEMFVLEFCEAESLSECELKWMVAFNVTDRNFGYNLRLDSASGMLAHADTRLKISANLKRQWANGERAGHSEKLKASWANAKPLRSAEQSERFRKSRTKFEYEIEYLNGDKKRCSYVELKTLGFKSSVGNMSRSGKNTTTCRNGNVVRRYPIGETPCL